MEDKSKKQYLIVDVACDKDKDKERGKKERYEKLA